VATVATPPATVSAPPTATTAHAPPADRPIVSRERDQALAPPSPIASTAQISANPSQHGGYAGDGGQAPPHVLSPAQRRALREREGHAVAATTIQSYPIATPASITLPAFPNQPLPPPAPVQAPAPAPAPAPSAPASTPTTSDEQIVPMSPLRKRIAERLVEAQHTAAILTTFNEIDMTSVLALRERHQERFTKQHGVKLGFMSFFVKAAIEALKAFPAVNAEIRGTDVIYKDHYDVGVAVGGGRGLVVPVVRDADRLSFADLEKTIGELAVRARDNKLTPKDLEGGTFTISNGGVYGSLMSTPILNPPQSGILGLHAIQKRPVVAPSGEVVVRSMMYVALSYDHRLVDGREAVQFLVRVKECVEDPERILLEV
jgi:2-oxoglutarate dehydrogenase E2 component (dihydrolipoamide succinyltransferase)